MEKYSGNQKGFIYASCDAKDREAVFDKYLGPVAESGVSFCWGDAFDKKEEDNIARSNAVLLFLTKDYARDDKLRKTVEAAVRNDKPILTVYLENVDLDSGLSMQLESQQALFVSYYESEEEFVEALKKAAIFDKIEVTEQQKKKQKSRSVIAIAAAVIAVLALAILIKPLLTPSNVNAETMEALGLQGLSKDDLESITELRIVGTDVTDYVDNNEKQVWYENGNTSRIVYINENGEEVTTERGTISDLSGMEQLTNLRALQLDGQQIEDITPLLSLENLEELSIACNPISSADGLEKLSNLSSLDISDTNIRELPDGMKLQFLKAENSLTVVPDFGGQNNVTFFGNRNTFTDVSNLATASSYDILEIEANGRDAQIIDALKGKTINTIGCAGMQISNLESLSGLKVSERLGLAWSDITSLDGLENFTEITKLDLKECTGLTDLSPVNDLPKLNYLAITEDMSDLADAVDDRIEVNYND